MRYGYLNVAAATPTVKVAHPAYNAEQVIHWMQTAAEREVELLVFPELVLSGYTAGDLFLQDALLDGCLEGLKKILSASRFCDFLVFVGMPLAVQGKLYNVAVAVYGGAILGVVPKRNVPNYGEFYEARHFTPGPRLQQATVLGQTVPFGTDLLFPLAGSEAVVACEICEDLWVPDPPSVRHALAGANVIVNLSASNEVVGKREYRRRLVSMQAAKLCCAYVYCDAGAGESTTDVVFAGHDLIAENGEILAESALFSTGLLFAQPDVSHLVFERRRQNTFPPSDRQGYAVLPWQIKPRMGELERVFPPRPFVPDGEERKRRAEIILSMQAEGLSKRVLHTAAKTLVVGISGGLDSTLALLVAVRAMDRCGRDRREILAVTMPGFGTTGRTFENARKLIAALGVTEKVIPISDAVNLHFRDIGQPEGVYDAAYENAQARERTQILMDLSNRFGGFVVGTGDLSELALGWATYNGDHMSMYGVNASVPKTLVKYLVESEAERLGGETEKVLRDVMATEISPELLPPKEGKIDQKTEDLVGPYVLHDFFLYHFLRWGESREKIAYLAGRTFFGIYDEQTIEKWLDVFFRRFFSQQFKRSCLPDGVKVGTVALSPRGDWRMPSDACDALWRTPPTVPPAIEKEDP